LNSGFKSTKTRAERISWRRNKLIELKAQGYNQEEIAQTLQVSPALISLDLQYLRNEAMQHIKEYTTNELPIQIMILKKGFTERYSDLLETFTRSKRRS
jgi:hypothetical protein